MEQQLANVDQRRQQLAQQYAAPRPTVSAKMPEIRLSVHMSKKDVPKGHFFIVDKNVEEGEEPIITDIGTEFECILLRDAKKISAFDGENNTSLVESTEFRDFQNDIIFVIDNAGERPVIATVATYSQVKAMKYAPTKDEIKQGKSIHPLYSVLKDAKLQYFAYVLYQAPGQDAPGIYLLKMGARGYLGVDKDGQSCRFGEEADTSFVKAASICHKKYRGATHMHTWRVFSSSFKTGEKETNDDGEEVAVVDHYPSFEITGEWTDEFLETVESAQAMLKEWMNNTYGRRIFFAWDKTTDRDYVPEHIAKALDAATGGEDMAAMVFGSRKAAAKSQLTVGGQQKQLDAGKAAPRQGSQAHVDSVADDLGGEGDSKKADEEPDAAAPAPAAPVPIKNEPPKPAPEEQQVQSGGNKTFSNLFKNKKPATAPAPAAPAKKGKTKPEVTERDVHDAAVAAEKNLTAGQHPMQHTDPNAPGYVPPEWMEGDQKPGDVKAIPKGW